MNRKEVAGFYKCSFLGGGAVFALLCASVFIPSALLAEKTTNTYTKASNSTSIEWSSTGLPTTEIQNTTGYDISIKIDYAEGFEKYQQLKTPQIPLYLDSVIGGKYHNLTLVKSGNYRYTVVNDPTPFEGFWSIADGSAKACGIYLRNDGGEGPRTISSAFIKGRFQFGVATGCEGMLDYPFGLGMFEVGRYSDMSPSFAAKGKLTVNRSPGPNTAVHVRNGTFALVGGDETVDSPVPGAWARFDASVADSLTKDDSGYVTAWSDADGNGVSMSVEFSANKPLWTEDAATGKKIVDFRPRSGAYDSSRGGSRLKFAEAQDGVAEAFFVLREISSTTPAFLIDDAFPRHGSANYLFKGWGSLPKELAMGEFRLNGQAVIPDVVYDLTRGLNVVSASYRSGGGSVTYVAGSSTQPSAGGVQFAEILLYTNTLTAAERRRNNDYLMKKWLGIGVRDYGAIRLVSSASLSVESGTARVRELALNTNVLVKAGAGTLEVESINTNLAAVAVAGGVVRFAKMLSHPENPQPAADPFAWFDADDEASFTTFTSNYTGNAGTLAPTNYTFVTGWRDKRDNGYTLSSMGKITDSRCANGEDYAALPTLDTNTASRTMVDLGPFYNPTSSKNFGWIAGNSGLSTWLRLYKDGSATGGGTRQGFVVFYKTSSNGNPINGDGWALRNAGGSNPSGKFVDDQHASMAAIGGHWKYDGVTVNPGGVSLTADRKTHLGSFMFADGAIDVNVFGADMNITGNSSGGCKIAEVILYNRVLTEQECVDTERYLMKKWNCGTHPEDRDLSTVGTFTFGDGTEAVFDIEDDMTIGRVVRESSGEVVKRGTGAATVQLFAPNEADVTSVSVEGGSLSLWCDPLTDAWTHLDAMRADSVVCETVNGTNFVTRWKDLSGHGNDATNPGASIAPKEKPVYRTVHLDNDNIIADSGRAIPVVDFGEYYNYEQLPSEGRTAYPTNTASGLTFPDKYVWLQEFYVVHADTDYWLGDGAGHNNNYMGILGYCGTGGPDGSQHPFLRGSQSPVINSLGNSLTRGGYIGVNGEQKNGDYGPTFKQLNAYTISASGQVSNKWCLAHRSNTQWGGQVLGEVIMFQNANSEARRNAITAMLCNKWRAQDVDLVSSWTLGSVTVANDASLTVGGAKGFAYTAGTLGGLGTITSGPAILGVTNVLIGAEETSGYPDSALSLTADVTLANDAHIDVYADAEGHISKVEMTGKLTVGGSGTATLHVPDGVEIPYGDHAIVTATSIDVTNPNASWTLDLDGELAKGGAKLVFDPINSKIDIRVYPRGFIVIMR